jgi:uncharacterized repeat protein (TIGR03803 family)
MRIRKSSLVVLASLCAAMLLATTFAHGQTESVLYSFFSDSGPIAPESPVIFDSHGNIYGTTPSSAPTPGGTVYELHLEDGTWHLTVLHYFDTTGDGSQPADGLVMDSNGNLYGTTPYGGAYNYGTVFQLKPSKTGWTEKILHSFNSNGTDGIYPMGSLVLDSSGNIYGTTKSGGSNYCVYGNANCGTVFELVKGSGNGWGEKILHNFAQDGDIDGYYPLGNLVFDKNGDLYGTTSFGGSNFEGTVFELVPHSSGAWAEKILYTFGGLPDGFNPSGGLVFDAAGNLYGFTPSGGSQAFGFGTAFELTPAAGGTWTKQTIYNFGASGDAAFPQGTPVLDSAGNLYGASMNGGSENAGTVFELSPSAAGWTESMLYSLTPSGSNYLDGENPYAGVVLDSSGNLYGTTRLGGSLESGVVFKLTP